MHVPAASVPGLTSPHGLPIGVQVIGAIGTDRQLFEVARWVHRHVACGSTWGHWSLRHRQEKP
jgi:Asp-tRNA(Asn)/Glu-tRNA(Gln) amidotransferase A subunit family amidase